LNYVRAAVVQGHGVASGTSKTDRRFPEGTIRLQLPLFKKRGLDVQQYLGPDMVMGTLNLSIAPCSYRINHPEHVFSQVKWTPLQPAENFCLATAEIVFHEHRYAALLYMPDPATKPAHFQPPDVIEVLAQRIPNVVDGSVLELGYRPADVTITIP
jgi:hypothetical protein